MSTVFSRRSFLKYTAVAAVAVAGTSLLGGCSGAEVSTSTKIGGSNTVLKVKSTLTALDFNATGNTATVTFHLHIENGRWNAIQVGNNNFFIYAGDKLYQGTGSIAVSLQPGSASGPQIKRGQEADYLIEIKNVPANVEPLTLTFMPDTQYNEHQSIWILDQETIKNATEGGTEQPGEGKTD